MAWQGSSAALLALLVCLYVLIECAFAQLRAPGAISKFNPGGQYIMLTFSGGPHRYSTPLILDMLKEKNVKATFFVSGVKSLGLVHILRRMHEEGHEIGNHGYHPTLFTKLSDDMILSSMHKTRELIRNATGVHSVHFARPPGGNTNLEVNELLKVNGHHKVILWSLDSRDLLRHKGRDVVEVVVRRASPGDVVLLHDSSNVTVEAIPAMIDQLKEKGFEILTISQVMSLPDDSPK
ncbi:hypothetical protein B484DRAFT_446052 [Ochromonadaceae sp. CCMP2298]|nr:hypothetical protein B484DRAFT_446052 [Ochromonadaceae sp. CCMP2298]|mmetsp:Transcript_29930/g.66203  ORF Transcript_29930/g.66203 Transcript_29930/m.66203 type:complete len:236 (-) Transcript_29930:132-839(-)